MSVSTELALQAEVAPWAPGQPHAALAEDVRWWVGTPASFGLYGHLALDQVALHGVAAAVDRTGRFAENFTNRGVRSYLWGPLMLFGDDADRAAVMTRLQRMHGEVRGEGKGAFEGTRFSALDPTLWKWVAVSSLRVFYEGYVRTYDLEQEEREVVYATLRWMAQGFDLPSEASRLPATLDEMEAYYDAVADSQLADNEFLQWAYTQFHRLPVPTLVGPRWASVLLTPLWRLLTPILGRPSMVCFQECTHPRMRELLGITPSRARRIEFALYTRLMRAVRRVAPKWLLLDRLAWNRYRYEQLRRRYERPQLASFAPPELG